MIGPIYDFLSIQKVSADATVGVSLIDNVGAYACVFCTWGEISVLSFHPYGLVSGD